MKHLRILVICIIFCSSSFAQNKKPLLSKKEKIEKKENSDSILKNNDDFPRLGRINQDSKKIFQKQWRLLISPKRAIMKCNHCLGVACDGLYLKFSKKEKEWSVFCGGIKGFNYIEDNKYEIIVNEYHLTDPPADASSTSFELVRIISKKHFKY
jgi:hypothetical protein